MPKKVQGCRDFIDGIDNLIKLRISQQQPHTTPFGFRQSEEHIELLKRELVDEFRKHSGAHGIYVDE